MGLWDPCALREGNRWHVGSVPREGVASCTVWRCPSSVGLRDCWVSGIPVEGRSLGVLPSAWGALQDSPRPLTPFHSPQECLGWQLWSAPKPALQSLFASPALGLLGDMCTCWPLRERRRAHPLFSQGALPKGGKAASLDRINLAYRTKDSHDIQFPPIN